MEIKSWSDLKEFANQLSEEQLSKPVVWTGEEEGGTITIAENLEEDYINPQDFYEPRSSYKEEPDYEEVYKDYPTNWKKGTPILYNRF